jgi:hypothetical protein
MNNWVPVPGEQVEVVSNESYGLWIDGSRDLQPGDIITILDVKNPDSKSRVITYKAKFVDEDGMVGDCVQYILLSDIKPILKTVQCTCDIISLMNRGCTCGYIQNERAR